MRIALMTFAATAALILMMDGRNSDGGEPTKEFVVKIVTTDAGGFKFDPPTVNINAGDSVRFVNESVGHTATSVDLKTGDPKKTFNTGVLKKGQAAVIFFNAPGDFNYRCEIHTTMTGTIKVAAPK